MYCIYIRLYNIHWYTAGMGNSKLLEGQFLELKNLKGQSIESKNKRLLKITFFNYQITRNK